MFYKRIVKAYLIWFKIKESVFWHSVLTQINSGLLIELPTLKLGGQFLF